MVLVPILLPLLLRDSMFRLFMRLPNLKVLQMPVKVPQTLDMYTFSKSGPLSLSDVVFPQVRKLRFNLTGSPYVSYLPVL